ncbi:MAG: LUD domain-containing protein [Actinomycetota bacterium]|nr:LUD domain-containing protein [Actinomycetota bacterium]
MTGEESGSAREVVLRRVRNALAEVTDTEVAVPRAYARGVEGDVVTLFAERVADYRATVCEVNRKELQSEISHYLRSVGVDHVVVPADLPNGWLAEADVTLRVDSPALSASDLDGCGAVITGCAVAIAETGTIVLDAGVAQGRRAITLVPDVHLCVVRADQVVGTVPEAMARLDGTRPLTWISGPSATSDIELSRVEGVHGPRTLIVLLVR